MTGQDSGAGSGRTGKVMFPQSSVYKGRGSYLKFVWSRGTQAAVCAGVFQCLDEMILARHESPAQVSVRSGAGDSCSLVAVSILVSVYVFT